MGHVGRCIDDISSNFIPYDFKSFMMRSFKVPELLLISRAVGEKNQLPIIQAIGNTIDVDVDSLTIPDFYNLFYWQRFDSYLKTPFYIEWVCKNVVSGTICGTENRERVSKSNLIVHYLKDCGDIKLGTGIDWPRVSILKSLDDKERDDPLGSMYSVAMWVADGSTIDEKMDILINSPDLELYEDAVHASRTFKYGVNEFVNTKCGGCGVKGYNKLSFDATTFLP